MIILVLLALLIALIVVYYQYYFRETKNRSLLSLAVFRFLTIFSLLLLLINPKIEKKIIENIKPKLLVAIDNSSSIAFSKNDSLVKYLVNNLSNNKRINNKFDVEYYSFGSDLKSLTKLTFDENQTNIYEAIGSLNTLSAKNIAPIILISDGNQTYGRDYKYIKSKQVVYPIIIGDTIQYSDLEISQINVNSYSYLENNFPVEVFIRFKGNKKITSNFTILGKNNRALYKQNLEFSKDKNNARLLFNLPAEKVGKYQYKAIIEPFNNEVNTINNEKTFSIDIIDEQAKIALVYDVLHPDIGMLKRSIESNKQHEIRIVDIDLFINKVSEYDAFILYQPNEKFKNIFEDIQGSNKNHFIITGKQTDWNFLNNIQDVFKNDVILNTEEFFPDFNVNFSNFHLEDLGFSDFPPLEGLLGEIEFSSPYESILTQMIDGIATENPLLVTYTDKNSRGAVLFGENIWKWRALSFQTELSFQKFDQFFNSIIQFLTISKKSNKLELKYNSIYYSDESIKIKAKSYDSNFNFDINSELELFLNKRVVGIPFYLNGGFFEVNINDLKSGNYNFSVVDKLNFKKKSGAFTVVDYSIEQEISGANSKDLKMLSYNSKGLSFFPDQIGKLINNILKESNLATIQKEEIKKLSLIDWKWLLGLIMLSLTTEWFIRKYRGLV